MESDGPVSWKRRYAPHTLAGVQGTSLVLLGEELFSFGGRLEGKGRFYSDRLLRGGFGDQDLFEEVARSEPWPRARHNHAMTALTDDQAVLFGGACHGEPQQRKGYFDPLYLDDVWLFSAASCSWRRFKVDGTQAPVARHCHTLDRITPAKLVLFGGFGGGAYLNDLWLLDLDVERGECQWTVVPSGPGLSPSIRSQHSACILQGKLLIFGGYFWTEKNRKERYFNDLYAFDLERREWQPVEMKGALPHQRNRANLLVLRGRCFLINGNFYDNVRGSDQWFSEYGVLFFFSHHLCFLFPLSASVHELHFGERKWERLAVDLSNAPQASHMAVACSDSRAFLFGGECKSKRYSHLFTFAVE